MERSIRAIFLDLGGTFRIVEDNIPYKTAARQRIAALTGTSMEAEAFHSLIEQRYDAYRDWALKYMCEAPEDQLWTRWLAPECDHALLEKNAIELTYELRRAKGERVVVKDGVETVKELVRRGYKVGVISDLIGTKEIDEWLDHDGLRPYFCTVQQSSVTMLRKPHPAIYFLALAECGVRPEESAFVGDNLQRDIIGAKATNFGATIAVEYPDAKKLKLTRENQPDGIICRFNQLLDIFPQAPDINLSAMEQRIVE